MTLWTNVHTQTQNERGNIKMEKTKGKREIMILKPFLLAQAFIVKTNINFMIFFNIRENSLNPMLYMIFQYG